MCALFVLCFIVTFVLCALSVLCLIVIYLCDARSLCVAFGYYVRDVHSLCFMFVSFNGYRHLASPRELVNPKPFCYATGF
jgi:hypothetical protein